jgi:hypothetical protein
METPEENDSIAVAGSSPVPCSQCVLIVRDRGTDGDPTIILKKDLDAAMTHKRRIIKRVGAIQPGECPFEIEIFHLVPANND